ncbi:periplasmic sensor signal transduction histidine kinase [Oceanicola granulosus HTCC2516]|uniref:histidine kinase n=1 Tax=Oceanicola granulosus (strain ATCC BAA-861 / DSM 15982 / KCTC 12143 / HTCC2516) TaxID=314256 RepID=Q2CI10_OCEGH|nr:HAMP domain-containing sensor histidine kinase [Oceanicola granulosus]EAR52448.1 periplasmic sensor signal transduction histidine kinase [Oceanicola granulosus HTCC2516]
MLNSLSGRFLVLTTVFVMLAEVMIFVPSVARFREDYLLLRLERAQIASLALLADELIDAELERELLDNAGVFNVVLRRDEVRQLVLSSPIPEDISATFDMRDATPLTLLHDAMRRLLDPTDRIIRVMGSPVQDGGLLIEVTMETGPLRAAMIDYGLRILALSAVISVITALLLFLAVRAILVKPIKGVIAAMQAYADAPEDARRIIIPQAGIRELREAEQALASMQTQLTGALKQKDRLAGLGAAVSKISHDLRNMLTSAQLFTDRIEGSDDPLVKRLAPKLVNSITRAVNLCETVLVFGRVEEPPPALNRVNLAAIVSDVIDSERLAAGEHDISFAEDIPYSMTLRADGEQLYRVLANLVRNARQAILATGKPGEICITAGEDEETWWIHVADTGPGLPARAREHLFQPFQGGATKGGSGLGLAISADLVRGHGGRLELRRTDETGTEFVISLPKTSMALPAAAE